MLFRKTWTRAKTRLLNWLGRNSFDAGSILASLPEPAFAIDLNGKVICWNPAMEGLTGVSADTMLGQRDYAYAMPIYGVRRPLLVNHIGLPEAEIRAMYPGARKIGDSWFVQVETQFLRGHFGYLSAIASPLLDARGRQVGAVEQIRDDTELYRSQEDVKILSLAVEQSQSAMVITDAQGQIQYVNAAFEEIYGYRADEVVGKNMSVLSSGLTERENIAKMWAALRAGEYWKGEFQNRCKNGEVRHILCRVSPIRKTDGQIIRYLATQDDVTERRRVAEELDRHRNHLSELVVERTAELAALKESAEAASEAKTAFLANMSHEIRTPMNGIIGLTRLVRQRLQEPKLQRSLDRVLETAQNLLHIINDILDISKIEANKMSLEVSDFYLPRLIERQIHLVQEQARQKGLSVQIKFATPVVQPLRGDSLRLGQVILNLVNNAVKFTQTGGVTVQVTLREASMGEGAEQGCRVRIEVQDTGPGIPEPIQKRLFENFEQADSSTTRRYGGTGLGLAISRRLIEMMGGEIGVYSQAGQGACFWFEVPMLLGTGEAVLHSDLDEAALDVQEILLQRLTVRHAGRRILLVDDNEINREVTLDLLEAAGLQVDLACDGAQAVEKTRAGAYELVLMDMQMPVMDGLTATRILRALPACSDLPILAMTANVFEEDRQTCLAAGMNDHLGKPLSPARLYEALDRWLPNAEIDELETPVLSSPVIPETISHEVVMAFLATLPGVNVQQGLESLRGRVPSYIRMLRKFAETQADDNEKLVSVLQARHEPAQEKEALRLAHSLKGVAATLGLMDLQARAEKLEGALKENAEVAVVEALAIDLAAVRCTLARQLLERLPQG